MSEKISRRAFLKLAGASALATAVLTGCGPASRYVVRRPYTNMPEYQGVGISTYYATTCRECPAGCGLIMRTFEGRAIKAEGNPEHPVNRGKICSKGLTAVQGLYNPDRNTEPGQHARNSDTFTPITWEAAIQTLTDAFSSGDGVAFLLGLAPDHLFDLVTELCDQIGAPPPVRYGATAMLDGRNTLLEAVRSVYGKPRLPFFDLFNADFVINFGANFMESWLAPVTYSRAYGHFRQGRPARGTLISFEPRQSLTSGNADEWYPAYPGSEGIVAAAIGNVVAGMRGTDAGPFDGYTLKDAADASGIPLGTLETIASRFAQSPAPLALPGSILAGAEDGLEAVRAVLLLNQMVGNTGQPGGVFLTQDDFDRPAVSSFDEVNALVERMNSGQVKTLLIHGVNPVFELPTALGFEAALQNVPSVISFASFPDETAFASDMVLPDHTSLESFGYQVALPGADRPTMSAMQPVVAPLYNTRSTADVLIAASNGALPYTDEVDFIQNRLLPLLGETGGTFSAPEVLSFWTQWLQKGGWWSTRPEMATGAVEVDPENNSQPLNLTTPEHTPEEGPLHLVVYAGLMGDGSVANRPWMQETPDPMTTVSWNSWVEIHPETAERLGLHHDDIALIKSDAGEVEAAVYVYPAIRPDTVAIPFGQGHTALGRYAAGRGVNPAHLLGVTLNDNGDLAFGSTLVTVEATGRRRPLARLESIDGVYGAEH